MKKGKGVCVMDNREKCGVEMDCSNNKMHEEMELLLKKCIQCPVKMTPKHRMRVAKGKAMRIISPLFRKITRLLFFLHFGM